MTKATATKKTSTKAISTVDAISAAKPAKKTAKKATKATKKATAKPTKKSEGNGKPSSGNPRSVAKSVGLKPNHVKVLEALEKVNELTSVKLSEITGIVKGKKLPELAELGYIKTSQHEGSRSYIHSITKTGKTILAKVHKLTA